MISPRDTARRLAAPCAGLAALAFAPPATATPTDLFLERSVMVAADARCGLFTPPVRAALIAGRNQARRTAIKAGAAEAHLASLAQRAQASAASADCASPQM